MYRKYSCRSIGFGLVRVERNYLRPSSKLDRWAEGKTTKHSQTTTEDNYRQVKLKHSSPNIQFTHSKKISFQIESSMLKNYYSLKGEIIYPTFSKKHKFQFNGKTGLEDNSFHLFSLILFFYFMFFNSLVVII